MSTRRSVLASSSLLALAAAARSLPAIAETAAPTTEGQPAVSEEEARAVGVDAYLYFYPLISMDITRKQSTNIEPSKAIGKGPMNMFVNAPTYPPADFRVVVRPNFDTLYSVAWLDLTKDSMIVSAPDTDGRYYLLPMLDMWTGCVRIPRLAHHRHPGGKIPRYSTRLEGNRAFG